MFARRPGSGRNDTVAVFTRDAASLSVALPVLPAFERIRSKCAIRKAARYDQNVVPARQDGLAAALVFLYAQYSGRDHHGTGLLHRS